MTRVEKLKQTISRNPAARILLYLAALVMPVAAYCNINTNAFGGAFEKLGFHNVMWLGFYSCLILLWACNYKCREKLVNLVLVIKFIANNYIAERDFNIWFLGNCRSYCSYHCSVFQFPQHAHPVCNIDYNGWYSILPERRLGGTVEQKRRCGINYRRAIV